jgi:hypothetical protein
MTFGGHILLEIVYTIHNNSQSVSGLTSNKSLINIILKGTSGIQ